MHLGFSQGHETLGHDTLDLSLAQGVWEIVNTWSHITNSVGELQDSSMLTRFPIAHWSGHWILDSIATPRHKSSTSAELLADSKVIRRCHMWLWNGSMNGNQLHGVAICWCIVLKFSRGFLKIPLTFCRGCALALASILLPHLGETGTFS